MGKYVIRKTPSGYKFDLLAGNNVVISMSEVYTTLDACKHGIESVRKNAPAAHIEDTTIEGGPDVKCPKFQIYADKSGAPRFRLLASNGQNIVSCGEPYSSKASALKGVASVQKNAADATVEERI